jgi:hypothetical protein
MLIEAGAAHDVVDETGMSPLYAAVDMHALPWGFGSPEPEAQRSQGQPRHPEDAAGPRRQPERHLKRAALQRLHTPGDPTLTAGATPFMRAAKSGDVTVMRLLLDPAPIRRRCRPITRRR